MERVVPLTVKRGWLQLDVGERRVCYLLLGGGRRGIERGAALQPHRGGGAADEVDDHVVAHERAAAPVLGAMSEQPMLDFVPRAGARWEVAHGHAQAALVGEALERPLPPS